MNEAKLLMFTYASFSNARNLRSQLGFIILVADKKGNANMIHYGSVGCSGVTRSVMASALNALTHGLDNEYVIQDLLEEVKGTKYPIVAYVEYKNVFYTMAKQAKRQKKGCR